jgi:hypothetical protein
VSTPEQALACLRFLQGFSDETQALSHFVDSGQARSREGKQEARSRLAELKMRLRGEAHRTSTVRGRAQLTELERDCYAPAVQGACAAIRVTSGSLPGHSWCSDLGAAQLELARGVKELRGLIG